jgi:vacuolar iron transporter family protein
MENNKHIKEKSVVEHLAKARQKGYTASLELHNYGFSSKLFSFIDSLRDGILLFALLSLTVHKALWPVAIGFTLWKGLKTSLQGFMRLERLHSLIREEKYEIEHHRDEEKQELMAIYEAKGFKGPILEEVVATLMADDNRLLQVMLEEEMGVSFEVLDHPVVSGAMSALGTLCAFFVIISLSFNPYGMIAGSFLIILLGVIYESKKQKISIFNNLVWSIASLVFIFMIAHFVQKLSL